MAEQLPFRSTVVLAGGAAVQGMCVMGVGVDLSADINGGVQI